MSADETLESPVAIAAPLFRKRVRKGPGRANGRSKPVESQPAPGSDSDLSDAESEAAASAAEERKKKRLNNDRNPLFQRSTRRAKDSTTAATAVDANAPTTTSIQDPVPGTAANFNGGDTQQKEKDQATRTIDLDGNEEQEAKRVLAQHLAEQEVDESPDGVYRGIGKYRTFQKKPKDGIMDSKMSIGPQKAPSHLRVTSRFDYQPNICKDYKETGFCGYGDTCIFLHDRSDYKSGWQLEKEWEEQQKAKIRGGGQGDEEDFRIHSDEEGDDELLGEDGLPFACFICRQDFTRPVVTKCGHYFCEACALKRFQKTAKCAACNNPTSGIFNAAKKLEEQLKARKARMDRSHPLEQDEEEEEA